ncbi:MAG: hypothetical protein LUE17_09295 [Planctomycetaceae bacterium]|nr:hypothetical protein [Planctomycetaceae bacterium]
MKIPAWYRRPGTVAIAALATVWLLAATASTLDFNDVVLMKENGVADTVILNMLEDSGGIAMTAEQEGQLRALGASEALLAAAQTLAPAPVPVPVQAAPVVQSSPTVTVVEPAGPVPIMEMAALPPRYQKEGWVSVSNSGWETYYLVVDTDAKRMFLSQTPNGGVSIDPGQNIALNVRKETYKMYGQNGRELKVRVRENEVTRITMTPMGAPGGGLLTVSAQDRERVRSEVLFGHVMPAPSPVIVEPAPAVIVRPAPVYVPYHRRYYGPYRGHGFGFGYGW